jgi:hypothetical protein
MQIDTQVHAHLHIQRHKQVHESNRIMLELGMRLGLWE